MPRSKTYKASLPPSNTEELSGNDADSLIIALPANPANTRQLDLNRWIGLGFDDWVRASAEALRGRLRSGFTPSTVVGLVAGGLSRFIAFLSECDPKSVPRRPRDVRAVDVTRYAAWLRRKYENTQTARSTFAQFKLLLMALQDCGQIDERASDWMPANPFPVATRPERGSDTLSPDEMQRFASALKKDLVAIHRGEFAGSGADAICVPFLIIAMRSGVNLTPLVEMSRDCLRPHPIMPNMMLLDTVKRRKGGAQTTLLRKPAVDGSATAIQTDAVAVLKKALDMTADLAAAAPESIKDRVWLFRRPLNGPKKGMLDCLTPAAVGDAIGSMVKRHALSADDGTTLRVTVGILRKTKANLLWRLTDGDLAIVAAAMGHTPQVADNHYLKLDDRGKVEGAKFVGEIFVDGLRGSGLTATPTGRCKDSLMGSLAPKDGSTHCAEFMNCLSCPSYAIVGTVNDLHRLFSYQQFLQSEMKIFDSAEWAGWRMQRQRLVEYVDKVAQENFPSAIVEEAKSLAVRTPHPFWAIKTRSSAATYDGDNHG